MKKAVKKFEHPALHGNITDQPALYVGTYAKYNDGNLDGAWVDLTEIADKDEFYEVCKGLHNDESDPEYMFQDYQGFPQKLYDEGSTSNELWKYLELIKTEDVDIINAGLELGIDLNRIADAYYGHYSSFREFSDQLADEDMHGVPDRIQIYFDYEAYARDLRYDFDEYGGYIFTTNY